MHPIARASSSDPTWSQLTSVRGAADPHKITLPLIVSISTLLGDTSFSRATALLLNSG
jgi:hypothetical protein